MDRYIWESGRREGERRILTFLLGREPEESEDDHG